MNKENKKSVAWYDNPNFVADFLLVLIAVIIIGSESFAIHNNLSTMDIFRNIMNHNSIYFLVLAYFVILKFQFGKKYFNFLNLFLIFLYFITMITSGLTIFQSFSLDALLSFCIHVLLVIYLIHTFFRGTRIWSEFKLAKSPFHELSNEWYFYAIFILDIIVLAVNLISTTSFAGTVLCCLDFLYIVLFARYIYLYQAFLNEHKKDVPPSSTKYLDRIAEATSDMKDKVVEWTEEHPVDETLENITNKVEEVADATKKSVQQTIRKAKTAKKESPVKKESKKGEKKGGKQA